jgi:hypothetical protein
MIKVMIKAAMCTKHVAVREEAREREKSIMSVSKRMLGVVERKNRGAICWRECEEYLSIQFAETNEYWSLRSRRQ